MREAQQILNQYWDGRLPIDPGAIAMCLGIRLVEDNSMNYDGLFRFEGPEGTPTIYYSTSKPPVRLRFTLAHEVGHFVFGDTDMRRDTRETLSTHVSDYREVRANSFAASLLMPQSQIELAVFQRGIKSIERLSNLFFVSEAAMQFRLKNIGLIS